ncbi:hypothetical protein [Rhizobium sp. Root482]|uniref:hypothetical protein n=1 Tax=Rhizobium sp. Root482 TaxID=1736543 RepID=UPI0012E3DB7C|nr:hypothetical protein [Rhizobium sp. Root482]
MRSTYAHSNAWYRPAEFVTVEVEASHRGTYTHNDNDSTEWSLIWTQLDGL